MLVLVSFGLVLLATILLVVGLLNDDGLTLIYLSIAASATAAVVLYVAFRRARPSGDTTTAAPAPLADDIVAPTEPASEEQTAVTPAATPSPPPPTPEPAPAPEPEPSYAASDDDWMSDAEWEGDIEFPIADYDDLTVAEIMPLLPQLYSDELDDVIERERSGKNRATILDRLEELKQIGTDADIAEAELEPTPEPTPEPAAAPEPAPAPRPAPLGGGTSLLDLDEGEDEELFPIADYDGLSVSQIVPLLSQLETDELEEVRAREVNGAGRKTLITEIDALLPGGSPEVPPEPAPAEPAPAPAAAPSPPPAAPEESAAAGKKAATEKAASKKKATAKKTRAKKKAATKKASKKKATAKKARSKKKAATKKAAASRFPIANYDELKVAEIRPRLSELSERQLRQVRERELAGAGRKTILDEIDRKLS